MEGAYIPPTPAETDAGGAKEADYRRRAERIVSDAGITDPDFHRRLVEGIVAKAGLPAASRPTRHGC